MNHRIAIFSDVHKDRWHPTAEAAFTRAIEFEKDQRSLLISNGDMADRLAGYHGLTPGFGDFNLLAEGNHDPGEGQPVVWYNDLRVEHGDRLDPLWSRHWFIRPISWWAVTGYYRLLGDSMLYERAEDVGWFRAVRDRGAEDRWFQWMERSRVHLLVIGHWHTPQIITRGDYTLVVTGGWLKPPFMYAVLIKAHAYSQWKIELVEAKGAEDDQQADT